jgi:glycopeptide antibiotics resistance protein
MVDHHSSPKAQADRLAIERFVRRMDQVRVPVRAAYVGIVLLATLTSLRLDLDASMVAERFQRMLRPTISGRDAVDGARNLVLFAGWGLLWMATSAPGRSWAALRNALLTGAALSLFVEGLQLLSDTRVASVLDLATNSGGALLGALALATIVISLSRATGARSFVGVPASIFAVSYGAAVLGEALVPLFRQEMGVPAISGGPQERLVAALDAFRWQSLLEPPLGDFLLFLPAGAFIVAALYESGRPYRSSAVLVSAGAAVFLTVTEVAHGALGIGIHAGAALVHTIAVGSGAWLAAAGLAGFSRRFRGVQRPRLVTVTYAVVLVLWASRPYSLELSLAAVAAKLDSDWWIPLRFSAMRMDMFSVVDVVVWFFLYLPVGGLLAVWPLRLRGWLAGFAPALYMAAVTEFSQILWASRTLDITDLLVQSAAAAVGWVVIRRAGFRPYGGQLAQ